MKANNEKKNRRNRFIIVLALIGGLVLGIVVWDPVVALAKEVAERSRQQDQYWDFYRERLSGRLNLVKEGFEVEFSDYVKEARYQYLLALQDPGNEREFISLRHERMTASLAWLDKDDVGTRALHAETLAAAEGQNFRADYYRSDSSSLENRLVSIARERGRLERALKEIEANRPQLAQAYYRLEQIKNSSSES